jgi:hypothetical protein
MANHSLVAGCVCEACAHCVASKLSSFNLFGIERIALVNPGPVWIQLVTREPCQFQFCEVPLDVVQLLHFHFVKPPALILSAFSLDPLDL